MTPTPNRLRRHAPTCSGSIAQWQGGPNLGRERAVAYVVLGVGDGAVDNSNFSPVAIRDESPRVLEQLPSWDDW